jgi:hypothetical protein
MDEFKPYDKIIPLNRYCYCEVCKIVTVFRIIEIMDNFCIANIKCINCETKHLMVLWYKINFDKTLYNFTKKFTMIKI